MSVAHKPSGRRLPALAVTALVHAAGLALAASAFHVVPAPHGEPDGLRVAVFPSQSSPVPARPPERPVRQAAEMRERTASHDVAGQSARTPPPATPAASRPAEPLAGNGGTEPARPVMRPAPQPVEPQLSGPGKEDALAAYTALLRQRILERRPHGLRKQGTVTVAFQLDRLGQLAGCAVTAPSGDVQLDRLALRMVRQAAPFPKAPGGVPDARLDFSLSINFR